MGYTILDQVAVKELASNKLRDNLAQGVIAINGRGVNMRWAEDLGGMYIDIPHAKMPSKFGREVGASNNGGFFNNENNELEMDFYQLPLTFTYDAYTDVPELALNTSSGELMNTILDNQVKQADRTINTAYLATLLVAGLQAGIKATSTGGTVSYSKDAKYITKMADSTAAGALTALLAAGANLDAGDLDNGYDYFEKGNRELVCRSSYSNLLKQNAGVYVANYLGQQMMADGGLSPNVRPQLKNGYIGELDGAAAVLGDSIFALAEDWLAKETLATGAKTVVTSGALDPVVGVLVAGDAVAGGVDRRSEVKVIDSPKGQGYRLQPLVRCGFTVFTPKAVQIITDSTGITETNFVTYTGSGSTATQTVKPSIYAKGNQA